MKIGKRTAKLIREAAVAGFVAGHQFGPPRGAEDIEAEFPTDAAIWVFTLRTARMASENFPALRRIAAESAELAADDQRASAATLALLRSLQASTEE